MDLQGWNERYLSGNRASEDWSETPTPLVVRTAAQLASRALIHCDALDLASGSGRNALWLAENGWRVTAVDGAEAAIAILRTRAKEHNLAVTAVVADLTCDAYPIAHSAWDLIVIAYYLQRDLFDRAKAGVRPGGVILVIVHIAEKDEEPTAHRLRLGELTQYFAGWEILHQYEGPPCDESHHRSVAELVARKFP